MASVKTYTMLCLGDSYTIGERVTVEERFPEQVIALLKKENIQIASPKIIATTGWTTDELNNAIDAEKIHNTFDIVTLLIGVNNQYRGCDTGNYREEFRNLLHRAIGFTGNNFTHVFVLSIPDWGVTDFAEGRDRNKIAEEIDLFNAINKQETILKKANYIDITPVSRKAKDDKTLTAEDKLHPSSKMYAQWAIMLAEKINDVLK